ncbi:BMC domain-containing protein [Clostridium sp. OS1-26]|uniref:BMC domain-containing protein n=1 Tax=Clostridium sp. OS1-26 TaxID=3070681 RepID=UPI0027E0308A|nr:BMC domain-containing protein [Clostridium sp. OS1-26]WML34096.1 BMC domain-containing protein [Clostridium sp. OS1-26]
MQALGLIETKGLLAAIEAADTMVKSADVSIIEKTYVGGGLVTISITGDVGAVQASIEAGAAAVKKLHEEFLVSQHVIPRPHQELESIIGPKSPEDSVSSEDIDNKDVENEDSLDDIEEAKNIENEGSIDEQDVEETKDAEVEDVEKAEDNIEKDQDTLDSDKIHRVNLDNLHKDDVDELVSKNGIEEALFMLSKLKVVKLRNLAREYKDFVITGRAISKADKNLLIAKFKLYYEKK